jgi:hypothetical protein
MKPKGGTRKPLKRDEGTGVAPQRSRRATEPGMKRYGVLAS